MGSRKLPIVLLVVAWLIAACSSGGSPPSAPTAPQLSAYDRVLQQVHTDGTVDTSTALAAFSLAIAPLPGVPTPPGPQDAIASGSAAMDWVLGAWPRLTPAEQQAIQQALGGVELASFIQGPVVANPNAECSTADSAAATTMQWKLDLNLVIEKIHNQIGRPLGLPVFLEVNTQQLVHPRAFMYTVACVGTKLAVTTDPTSCTIHINPLAMSAQFTDLDRQSSLAHEAMHCFLWDKFGIKKLAVPPWLREGVPEWTEVALYGADNVSTAWWGMYQNLTAMKTLFGRSYDALGYFAQLADSGVDVWKKIDPMIAAFLSGADCDSGKGCNNTAGNDAAWQASGAGDAFVGSWGAGYARGRHPGKSWDITGYGVPNMKPVLSRFDLVGTAPAPVNVAAPRAAVNLVVLNLQSDVVTFTGDSSTQGLLGTADGGEQSLATLMGKDLCTRPGGCTCPPGSANEGAQLSPLARGDSYLGISGGLAAAKVSVFGMSLEDFCKQTPRQNCLVGTWTTSQFNIQIGNGVGSEQGGAGAVMRITPTGAATVDFSPMQPVTFDEANSTGTLRFDGSSTGQMTLPPPNVTTGNWDAHPGMNNVTVTVAFTSPFQAVVLDHRPISGMVGQGGLAAGIPAQPLLGPGGFTCTNTTLTVTPPSGAPLNGSTWTLTRTGR